MEYIDKILVNINGDYSLLTREEWGDLFDKLEQGDQIQAGGVRRIEKRGRK